MSFQINETKLTKFVRACPRCRRRARRRAVVGRHAPRGQYVAYAQMINIAS